MFMKVEFKSLLVVVVTMIVVAVSWWEISNHSYSPATCVYFACIEVRDHATQESLEFEVKWDIESLSRFSKGSEAAVIVKQADSSKVVFLTGEFLKDGLPLTVSSDGYEPVQIIITAQPGGIATKGPNQVTRLLVNRCAPN